MSKNDRYDEMRAARLIRATLADEPHHWMSVVREIGGSRAKTWAVIRTLVVALVDAGRTIHGDDEAALAAIERILCQLDEKELV